MDLPTCPECASENLYRSVPTSTWGSDNPGQSIFPGLGSALAQAKFTVLVCADCGLSRLYLTSEARARLGRSDGFRRAV